MIVSALSVYPAAADLPTGATIGCTLRLVLLLLALMRVLLPRRERPPDPRSFSVNGVRLYAISRFDSVDSW
jgi:hypothetical protein